MERTSEEFGRRAGLLWNRASSPARSPAASGLPSLSRRHGWEGRSGGAMACVFLRMAEEDLRIVRRWRIRIGNYWRGFFSLFPKK